MKKSLAQLKRDASTGNMSLILIERFGESNESTIPPKMAGARKVIGVNTVALKLLNHDGKESELRYNPASLIEYDGDKLTVYNAGKRSLTDDEANVLKKANEERALYRERNPYSESYWHMEQFFANCPYPYLDGFEMKQGKRYNHCDNTVTDNAVKGEAILKYRVVME